MDALGLALIGQFGGIHLGGITTHATSGASFLFVNKKFDTFQGTAFGDTVLQLTNGIGNHL